jgi:hypothetical protein
MKLHVEVAQIGEYRRTHLLSLIECMRDLVLASGRIAESEFRDHASALSAHLADPQTTIVDKLVVQAWGQTPPSHLRPTPKSESQLKCAKADWGKIRNELKTGADLYGRNWMATGAFAPKPYPKISHSVVAKLAWWIN